MARKRRNKVRRVYAKAKKTYRRHRKSVQGFGGLVAAGVYGAARQRISQAIQPIVAKIPGGNIADEIGMLGVNWAASKFVGRKIPMIKDMAKAGMLIEAAAIGEALAGGTLTGGSNGASSAIIG